MTARDEGGKAATARVEITVLDVNDHAPAFTGLPYTFRVPEGEVGTNRITTRFLNDDNIDINAMYMLNTWPVLAGWFFKHGQLDKAMTVHSINVKIK